jgi:hypothetical protein
MKIILTDDLSMKILVRLFMLICFIVVCSDFFYAQSKFLERGESGFGVTSSIAYSEISSGYGLALGYSYHGILDLGLAVGRSYPGGTLSAETYGNFIAPQVSIFLMKQEKKPRSVSSVLSISYQFVELKQPYYSYSYNQGYFQFGGKEIQTSKTDAGSISLSFLGNLSGDIDPLLQTDLSLEFARSKNVNQFCFLFGFSVGSHLTQTSILAFTPAVGVILIEGRKFIVGGLEGSFIF